MSEGIKRRDFLKVVGAGSAVATAGCSTGDVTRLIPYVVPAEDIVPGVPTWYTSTCRECPAGCGIQVETHSGRATKVEGNPNHPISHGNLCGRGQASVQGLYHPDRIAGPLTREGGGQLINLTWGTAERLLVERLQDAAPGSVVFLSKRYGGSMDALVDEWAATVGARRVVYDVWADHPRDLDFSEADVLVSFGADFLETWGSPVDYAWQFAQMHRYQEGRRGKFIWVGPHRPLTGLNADQWIAARPGTEIAIARALAGQMDVASAAAETEVPQEVLQTLVDEFRAGNGMAVGPGSAISGSNAAEMRGIINGLNGGSSTPSAQVASASEIQQLVQQMNGGQVSVLLIDAPDPVYSLPGALGFAEALENVDFKVSFSTFPDDTAAMADLMLPDHHFLEAWGDYMPQPGMFEIVQPTMRPVFNSKQVGDVLLSTAQQMGSPIGAGASTYYDYLRTRWQGISGGGEGWRQALRDGGVFPGEGGEGDPFAVEPAVAATAAAGAAATTPLAGDDPAVAELVTATAAPAAPVTPQATASTGGASIAFQGDGNFNLVVYPSSRFFDGRTANRPWMLELPDPVTKVPWGSWVELHPAAAEELGIEQGDIVRVSTAAGSVETYAYVYPGVRPDTVAIQAGLGHQAFGRYTEGVGVNPNRLLGVAADSAGAIGSYGTRVNVERIAGDPDNRGFDPGPGLFEQGSRIQHDREIARAVSVAELEELYEHGEASIPGEEEDITLVRGHGGFTPVTVGTAPEDYPAPQSRYGEYVADATRWAMVIDLERCTGCAACVTACYAENNIPVVGANEVKRGRDLSWLRIERYWGVTQDEEEALGDNATDDTRFLPMLCQHCGNAPCEPVCPVYAAYHTPDGLNGQVYNRCVGTRYCANNCPYKVRYFNWFTYQFAEPLNYQLNPDVTVREKGVMEKCTFCVQRIREGEHKAALEERPVRDGDITPACVQTCPSEVFVFGNIADENSRVAQAARSVRGYRTFEELNVQPAIVYLSKVTLQEPARGGHHAAEGEHAAEGAEAPAGAH